jgi:hypothetical protein
MRASAHEKTFTNRGDPMYNDYRVKSSTELSEYQKRIENIENTILCVSEVEKMVREIGTDLVPEDLEVPKKRPCLRSKCSKPFVGVRFTGREPLPKKTEARADKRRIAKIMYVSDATLLASDQSLRRPDSKD